MKLSASRMKRDEIDLGKVTEKIDSVTSFSSDESLRNIITGINVNENVNVQDLFEIGRDIIKEMDGQSVFSHSHKRSLNVKTLASSKNVKVSADRSIYPALLFQRFRVVSQTENLRVDDVLSNELCLYPMSLREKISCVRRTNRNLPKQSETMLKQNQTVVCSKLFQT